MLELNKIILGDALSILRQIPDSCIDCCITSPPYFGLRDYGNDNQIGLEKTPEEYVEKIVKLFNEIKRTLKKDGTVWLNLGDSYWGGGFGTSPGGNEDFEKRYPKQASNKGTKDHETRKKLGALKSGKHEYLKPKDLIGIPWRVAFALQADGWYLRQDIIWAKPNPMPESVQDRFCKSHEYVFLLSKSPRYYFDLEAVKELANYDGRKDTIMKGSAKYKDHIMPNGNPQTVASGEHERWNKNDNGDYVRNKRSVWTINTKPYKEAHFAVYPEELIIPMVKTTRKDAVILDPFMGSGTTALVAKKLLRSYIGVELNPEYIKLAEKRLSQQILI